MSGNNQGLFAGFISSFKILSFPINPTENKRINQAITYESSTLLSAVYEHFPFYENPVLEALFRKFNPVFFLRMPGVRFQLSEESCMEVWEKFAEDINALCRVYSLAEYNYHSDFVNNDKEKWENEVTDYLALIVPKLPEEIIPAVLSTLLREIKKYGSCWSIKKKLRVFALVMFYSKYFQTNSMLRKMRIIFSEAGILNGMVLMPGYFFLKTGLIKPIVQVIAKE